MPPCRRDLAGAGPYKVVQVGEKTVDFNPNFRLFMTTRNAHPDIPPDARDELYKNRSSRKIDSQRLLSREYDFPKTLSLTEN